MYSYSLKLPELITVVHIRETFIFTCNFVHYLIPRCCNLDVSISSAVWLSHVIFLFGAGGWVPYWKYADWMTVEAKSKFVLNHPQVGNVTVTDGGIYYVYSQVKTMHQFKSLCFSRISNFNYLFSIYSCGACKDVNLHGQFKFH